MCIIVIKPKGTKGVSKDILENCFSNNPDGAGIMYNDNGNVVIKKGFMEFEDFWKAANAIKGIKNKTVVYHCRIGTSGGNVAQNTHPFPISGKTGDLTMLEVVTDIGYAHNGMIDIDVDNGMSDTMTYIKRIAKFRRLIAERDQDFLALMGLSTKGSRLTILYPDGEVVTTGTGWIVDDGVTYSNGAYKECRLKARGWPEGGYWKDWQERKYGYGHEDDKPLFDTYEDNKYYCPECCSELENYGDWLFCPVCKNEFEDDKEGNVVNLAYGWENEGIENEDYENYQ